MSKPLRTLSELDVLIERTGFAEAAPLIRRLARRCWHIFPEGDTHVARFGGSRLGGSPELEAGRPWPRSKDGRLLTFFAQLNLSEISRLDRAFGLPATGLLSLFAGDVDPGTGRIETCASVTPTGTALARLPRPLEEEVFAGGDYIGMPLGTASAGRYFEAVGMRLEPGVSFPEDDGVTTRSLEDASPVGDIDALFDGLAVKPAGAIGQLFGYANFEGDLRRAVYFEDVGSAGQEHLEQWKSWEAWEDAKRIRVTRSTASGWLGWLRTGHSYQPWSSKDDENVRWILANRSAILAGVERWRALLRIDSNNPMNLWINDADSIFFVALLDDVGRTDFSRVRALVTQS